MIQYFRSPFGVNLLFRIHGSAVYRGMIPGLLSVVFLILFRKFWQPESKQVSTTTNVGGNNTVVLVTSSSLVSDELDHPYAIGVLFATITFLLVFRLQQAYARYWEAASSVHQMMSKWMDAVSHTGVYHLQCDHYKQIQPPSFFEYPELNASFLTRDREGLYYVDHVVDDGNGTGTGTGRGGAGGATASGGGGGGGGTGTAAVPCSTAVNASSTTATQHRQHSNDETERIGKRAVHKSIERISFTKRKSYQQSKGAKIARKLSLGNKSGIPISQRGGHFSPSPSAPTTAAGATAAMNSSGATDIHRNGGLSQRSAALHVASCSESKHSITTVNSSEPEFLEGTPRLDGNWGSLFRDGKATYFKPPKTAREFLRSAASAVSASDNSMMGDYNFIWGSGSGDDAEHSHAGHIDDGTPPPPPPVEGFASFQGGRTPPLFLQELAHLASLLTGVALSTLRNDVEGAESPLDIFQPGAPWPEVDPDKIKDGLAFNDSSVFGGFCRWLGDFSGMGRTPVGRTRYNASRPLSVIGGVSEAEIRFLQMSRGPFAKTQLCWAWLSEFIIREHLAGSTGPVGPPIISRVIQFLGDGMIYYNHARKIMFIPFPFPHAQLSAIYVLVAIPAVAFLMDQYAEETWLGCILCFLTVTALSGIHEVARELENPFRNVPNELPLVTFQAQFNEALLTMFAGYHPDHFWRESVDKFQPSRTAMPGNPEESTSDKDKNASTKAAEGDDVDKDADPSTGGGDKAGSAVTAVREELSAARAQAAVANERVQKLQKQLTTEEQVQQMFLKMNQQEEEIRQLRAMMNSRSTATPTPSTVSSLHESQQQQGPHDELDEAKQDEDAVDRKNR